MPDRREIIGARDAHEEEQHRREQEHVARSFQSSSIMESPGFPRVGLVGEGGRQAEVSVNAPDEDNVVITLVGGVDAKGTIYSAAGFTPAEARSIGMALVMAADRVERRHGRQE